MNDINPNVRLSDCCLKCKHKAVKYYDRGEEHCKLLNRWIFKHSICDNFKVKEVK